MAPVNYKLTSEKEFLKLRETMEDKVELIDDIVYMTPAPTPLHQKICFEIAKILDEYFAHKKCQMLQGVNIRLYDEEKRKIGDVIPDVSVFCDYKDLDKTFIDDIPRIIVEVVSPSTVYVDNIKKADLYKKAGVKEYWIVDLKAKVITVWNFDTNQQMICQEVVQSFMFGDLSIEINSLFS